MNILSKILKIHTINISTVIPGDKCTDKCMDKGTDKRLDKYLLDIQG
jgi:hypothetical protein